jgi:hypothetical protein
MDNVEIEQVRKRAYEIWEMRCKSKLWDYGKLGTPEGDFRQAEREIKYGTKNNLIK